MIQKIYQIDAFANRLFSGNPAAVCPLEEWLSDDVLQKIAMENNLSETAFYLKGKDPIPIRWFTPTKEVDLCGHATLATAFVLFNSEKYPGKELHFYSQRSGELVVTKNKELLTLNFPTDTFHSVPMSDAIVKCFDRKPQEVYKGKTDYLFVFEKEEDIVHIQPDFNEIIKLDCRGVIISAKGEKVDFVSRFFCPNVGVKEDPVTGSAHTTLIPFWAEKLNKIEMTAMQLSQRKGFLTCKYLKERVEISGEGQLYLTGEIKIK